MGPTALVDIKLWGDGCILLEFVTSLVDRFQDHNFRGISEFMSPTLYIPDYTLLPEYRTGRRSLIVHGDLQCSGNYDRTQLVCILTVPT